MTDVTNTYLPPHTVTVDRALLVGLLDAWGRFDADEDGTHATWNALADAMDELGEVLR